MSAALAFDVGGTWVRAGLVDESGRVLAQEQVPTPVGDGAALIGLLARLGGRLASATTPRPVALGLAMAGLLDRRSGRCLVSPNARYLDLDLVAPLEARLGLPVHLVNDVNAAARAEARLQGCSDLAAILVGTGVGTGFVCGGRLLTGATGMAGEGGHLIFRPGGEACPLGCRGCFESYLGGAALGRRAAATGVGQDAAALFAAWRSGDPRARPVVEDALAAMEALVTLIVVAFDPQVIVVGGGVGRETPELSAAAARAIATHPLGLMRRDIGVRPESRGQPVGLIGAALYALDLGATPD